MEQKDTQLSPAQILEPKPNKMVVVLSHQHWAVCVAVIGAQNTTRHTPEDGQEPAHYFEN